MNYSHLTATCVAMVALSQGACKPSLVPCGPQAAPPPPPKYVRVDYTGHRMIGGNTPAEISDTPSYQRDHTQWKSVALRVPNHCLTETASKVTGTAASSQAILTSSCGVWLKELEAALSREGYRVISWDALHRAETAGDMSTYQIAQKLGADVVFLINSLESTPTPVSDKGEQKLAFFESNETGDDLGKAQIDNERTKWIMQFVGKRVDATKATATGLRAHAAMLDLTAVSATGGESVWFYRRVQHRLLQGKLSDAMSFLFAHQPSKLLPGKEDWWPVAPAVVMAPIPDVPVEPTLNSEVTISSSGSTAPEDEERAIELELVRIVVKDFVQNFKNGRSGSSPSGAPSANGTGG